MTVEELAERVRRLSTYRFKGQPAVYQPLALLWSFSRARRNEPRLVAWPETEQALGALLEQYAVHGERRRADYPVAALHRAGLWEIPEHYGEVPSAHGDAGLLRWFTDRQPVSGLVEPAYRLVQHQDWAVVNVIVSTYLSEIDHEALLAQLQRATTL